jgi:hypothetical protein
MGDFGCSSLPLVAPRLFLALVPLLLAIFVGELQITIRAGIVIAQ